LPGTGTDSRRSIDLPDADADLVVERTDGVPASFVKEMTRRATLIAAERGAGSTEAADVHAAVDELMTANETLTMRLLGTGESADESEWSASAEPGVAPAPVRRGWFTYAPLRRHGGFDG
jgi:cell division protease FtsH